MKKRVQESGEQSRLLNTKERMNDEIQMTADAAPCKRREGDATARFLRKGDPVLAG